LLGAPADKLQSILSFVPLDRFVNHAERLFKIYLLEEPGSASAFSNLGNVHQQQGQAALAVEDYNMAVQLAPEVWPFVCSLCSIENVNDNSHGFGQGLVRLIPIAHASVF
jgi:tetratricopeptide (TPR) repeat protein